jgi:hypothetical protein
MLQGHQLAQDTSSRSENLESNAFTAIRATRHIKPIETRDTTRHDNSWLPRQACHQDRMKQAQKQTNMIKEGKSNDKENVSYPRHQQLQTSEPDCKHNQVRTNIRKGTI